MTFSDLYKVKDTIKGKIKEYVNDDKYTKSDKEKYKEFVKESGIDPDYIMYKYYENEWDLSDYIERMHELMDINKDKYKF